MAWVACVICETVVHLCRAALINCGCGECCNDGRNGFDRCVLVMCDVYCFGCWLLLICKTYKSISLEWKRFRIRKIAELKLNVSQFSGCLSKITKSCVAPLASITITISSQCSFILRIYVAMNDFVANRYSGEFLAFSIRIVCNVALQSTHGGLEFCVHVERCVSSENSTYFHRILLISTFSSNYLVNNNMYLHNNIYLFSHFHNKSSPELPQLQRKPTHINRCHPLETRRI